MKPIMRIAFAMMAFVLLPSEVLAQEFRGLCVFRDSAERPNLMCVSGGFSDENGFAIACNPSQVFLMVPGKPRASEIARMTISLDGEAYSMEGKTAERGNAIELSVNAPEFVEWVSGHSTLDFMVVHTVGVETATIDLSTWASESSSLKTACGW